VEVQSPVDGRYMAAPASAVPRWVEQPNPDLDRVALVTQLTLSLLLDGNAFVVPLLDNRGTVAEVHALDPKRVSIDKSPSGDAVYLVDGARVQTPILHSPALVLAGSVRGVSPVEMARQIIGIGLGVNDQAARFFSQGTITPGVIETQADLSVEQMREIRDQWISSHGGSRRAHLPVVLGAAKFSPIAMTAEQAQFLESRKFTDAQIAGQLFRLDPSFLGIPVEGQGLLYQNLEARASHLVRVTLMPWLVRLERLMTRLLPATQRWRFNVDGLLRADLTTRYSAYATAASIGLLTIDEMRQLEDRPPLPDAPAAPMMDDDADRAAEARSVAHSASQPIVVSPHVTIHQAEHRNDPPVVHVTSPDVHVAAPDVRVDMPAPQITVQVEPTPVTIVNEVDVAAADVRVDVPAPNVTVAAPTVNVEAPQVTVQAPDTTSRFSVQRDRNGLITGVVET
jgi:HK97 family phage portal protein